MRRSASLPTSVGHGLRSGASISFLPPSGLAFVGPERCINEWQSAGRSTTHFEARRASRSGNYDTLRKCACEIRVMFMVRASRFARKYGRTVSATHTYSKSTCVHVKKRAVRRGGELKMTEMIRSSGVMILWLAQLVEVGLT